MEFSTKDIQGEIFIRERYVRSGIKNISTKNGLANCTGSCFSNSLDIFLKVVKMYMK